MPKDHSLVKISGSLISKGSADMNEYLKPMSRDIFLFSTKISGTYKLKDKLPLLKLSVGERLSFMRGMSKYEADQIEIHASDGALVGYVPEPDSPIFARLMEAGKMLFAIVKSVSHATSVPFVDIDIFLQDF